MLTKRFAVRPLTAMLAAACWAAVPARAEDFPQRAVTGMNVGGPSYYSPNLCFADAMKSARAWRRWEDNTKTWPHVDARGYPRKVAGDQAVFALVLNQHHPKGRYVLEYKGQADLELTCRFDGQAEGSVKLLWQAPGRRVYEIVPVNYIVLKVRHVDADDPIRDIHLWPAELAETRPVWNPAWVAGLRPFGALRFMDMLHTNHSELRTWSDRPVVEDMTYLSHGAPIEHVVVLCNALDADPWLCIPHQADDDYVRRFATLVRDRLDKGRTVYVEYSNEVGNRAFSQYGYARKKGIERGYVRRGDSPALANARFHAARSVEVFEIWRDVFGADSERIVGVITTIVRRPAQLREQRERFAFQDAWKKTDAFGTAPYIGVGLAARFPKPAADMTADEVMDMLFEYEQGQIQREYALARKITDEFDLPMIAYEGGQHLSVFGGKVPPAQHAAFARLVGECNESDRMAELYRLHLRNWYAAGGGLYCHFSYVSAAGKWGAWGFQERIGEPPATAPKLRALLELLRSETLPRPSEGAEATDAGSR